MARKSDVNLKSVDAMFARVLSELENLNAKADRIEVQATTTNGRVSALERFRDTMLARIGGFILAISLIGAALTWVLNRALEALL